MKKLDGYHSLDGEKPLSNFPDKNAESNTSPHQSHSTKSMAHRSCIRRKLPSTAQSSIYNQFCRENPIIIQKRKNIGNKNQNYTRFKIRGATMVSSWQQWLWLCMVAVVLVAGNGGVGGQRMAVGDGGPEEVPCCSYHFVKKGGEIVFL